MAGNISQTYQYEFYVPWNAAGTNGKNSLNANFQTDGNFVVYNTSGTATWASNTHTYHNAVGAPIRRQSRHLPVPGQHIAGPVVDRDIRPSS